MKLQRLNSFLTKSVMASLSVLFVTAASIPVFALGRLDVKDIDTKEVKERLGTMLGAHSDNPNFKVVVEAIFPDGLTKGVSAQLGIGENIGINKVLVTDTRGGPERVFVAKTRDFVDAFENIGKRSAVQRAEALKEMAGAVDALKSKSPDGKLTTLDRRFLASQLLVIGNTRGTGKYNARLADRIMKGSVMGQEAYDEAGTQHALEVLDIAAYLAMESRGTLGDSAAIDAAVDEYARTRTPEERKKMAECMGAIHAS